MTHGAKLIRVLAIVGAAGIIVFGYHALTSRETVKETVDQVAKDIDKATMRTGSYLVQLDEAELASDDWSLNVAGKPRSIRLKITSDGREIAKVDIGAFRGKKTFLEQPIAFDIDYDGKTPIEIELAELELLSEGRRYYAKGPWPFAQATIAQASHLRVTWKRTGDLRRSP